MSTSILLMMCYVMTMSLSFLCRHDEFDIITRLLMTANISGLEKKSEAGLTQALSVTADVG